MNPLWPQTPKTLLTRIAELSLQSKSIYLMATADGLPAKEIAQRLGMKENVVRSIRSRVAKMIAAAEREFE